MCNINDIRQNHCYPLNSLPPITLTTARFSNMEESASIQIIPHFLKLLREVQDLIHTFGPYETHLNVFIRSINSPESTAQDAVRTLAASFAAAQDSISTPQPSGPAKDDLALIQRLWPTTLAALDYLLGTGNLDSEALGWGVFGLASGYIGSSDPLFLSRKTRLHNALRLLPSMDQPGEKWKEYRAEMSRAVGKVHVLANVRAEIHVCATMLLQGFRREEWRTVRWYQAVMVVERWIGHLGLGERKEDGAGEETV